HRRGDGPAPTAAPCGGYLPPQQDGRCDARSASAAPLPGAKHETVASEALDESDSAQQILEPGIAAQRVPQRLDPQIDQKPMTLAAGASPSVDGALHVAANPARGARG